MDCLYSCFCSSAIRTATKGAQASGAACSDARGAFDTALQTLTDAVKADQKSKFDAAKMDAQSALDAANALNGEADGKVDHTALSDAINTLNSTLTPSGLDALDWKGLRDATTAITTAKSGLDSASQSVSQALVDWAAQQAQDAQAQASSASTGGGASYSGSSYDYSGGGSSGGGGYSGGYSSGGADVCGGGPYCYNPNYPEYTYDPDGWAHHQIQPDANGSWTDVLDPIP